MINFRVSVTQFLFSMVNKKQKQNGSKCHDYIIRFILNKYELKDICVHAALFVAALYCGHASTILNKRCLVSNLVLERGMSCQARLSVKRVLVQF